MGEAYVVALLGHGEAGSRFLRDLAGTDARISVFDPSPRTPVPIAHAAGSAAEAVGGADLVLSVNSGSVALDVARTVAPHLRPAAIFADLNTTAPALKRAICAVVGATQATFVDVAVMGPVPREGIHTFCLASGPAASRFVSIAESLGMNVEAISPEAGAAAERKLARSIFMKGLAASCIEARAAARLLGCEEWLLGEITRELEQANGALLDRLLQGSEQHASRRVGEMRAVEQMERDIHIDPRIARAAREWLQELAL